MADDLHAGIQARLRQAGQRYTTGRRALVQAIIDAERPLTTAELIAVSPGLPQSTAYRSLAALEQAGVLHRVRSSDDFARYELTEELGGHHHHLVCVSCGSIEDFTAPARFERTLADVIGRVTGRTSFRAETHRLDLLGTCGDCAS